MEHHPSYRHILVNTCLNLLLLDFFVLSDQELIEGAALAGWAGQMGWAAHTHIYTPPPRE